MDWQSTGGAETVDMSMDIDILVERPAEEAEDMMQVSMVYIASEEQALASNVKPSLCFFNCTPANLPMLSLSTAGTST